MSTNNKEQIVTSLKVDPALWKQAKIAALECDITLGELIDQAIREWIKNRERNGLSDEEAKEIALKYAPKQKGKKG
jgi:hypothetical protein